MIVIARKVCKEFRTDGVLQMVLSDVDIEIEKGEFIAIMGPSGSGKSTLLYVLGLMLRPTSVQSLKIDGEEFKDASSSRAVRARREKIGFVFQRFNLINTLTVEDNLKISLKVRGLDVDKKRIRELLDMVGLTDKLKSRPYQLSTGQQQRLAFARAVLHRPALLLADEPTGNLDSKNAEQIINMMRSYNKEFDQTILMVTHNPDLARRADRVLYMFDGRLYTGEPATLS